MRTRTAGWTLVGLVVAGLAGPGTVAEKREVGPFCSVEESWLVRSDAVQSGDRYILAAGGISMDGVHEGDLFGWSPKISIGGEVRGDVFAGANSIDITGTIRDSTRLFGQTVDIDGTIEGDLLIFAASLTLKDNAHITGNIYGSVAQFTHIGRVDGNVRMTTGESRIEGHVGKDLRLEADKITLSEGARIEGNLTYTSRTELPPEAADYVGGEIVHKELVDKEQDDEKRGFTMGRLMRWFYWPVGAFIVGSILLALSGRHKQLPVNRMNEEGWIGLAIGVFALPVLAVASIFGLLILPLGLIGLLLLVVLIFVGKIPTALWVGRRLLGLAGRTDPSPFLSLAVGLLIIYPLFSIPMGIGLVMWYVVTSAGIGALVLSVVALGRNGPGEPAAEA